MKKSKLKLSADTNTIVSFSAIAIALASIFISTWQGTEIRKHNRLSVRPKLEIHFYINKQDFGYSLLNNGLGPANIIDNKIFISGKEVTSSGTSHWSKILLDSLKLNNIAISVSDIWPGATIKAGERRDLLNFDLTGFDSLQIDPMDINNGLAFKIKYESMYGEIFTCQKPK